MSRLREEPRTPSAAARSWWPSLRNSAPREVGNVRQMRTGRLAASQPARDRRARIAVAALFLTNGALFANLLPRYPEIKADLGLSNAEYGAAVAAFSVGALVTGSLAASLIRRFHSARVAAWGHVGTAVLVWVAGVGG